MREHQRWDLGPGIKVVGAELSPEGWVVTASATGPSHCPGCGFGPAGRYGFSVRRLQDLPVQGRAVEVHLRMTRWRCGNAGCKRRTFAGKIEHLAAVYGRQTARAAELARLIAHAAQGRRAERLLHRLGLPQGDDRILRHLKRHAAEVPHGPLRVAGVDDWSWRRGTRYGTVVVDLERRSVVDVLPDRSAERFLAALADLARRDELAGIVIHMNDTYLAQERRIRGRLACPGFARVATFVRAVRDKLAISNLSDKLLLVHAGDFSLRHT